jgi:hypothetical protein
LVARAGREGLGMSKMIRSSFRKSSNVSREVNVKFLILPDRHFHESFQPAGNPMEMFMQAMEMFGLCFLAFTGLVVCADLIHTH